MLDFITLPWLLFTDGVSQLVAAVAVSTALAFFAPYTSIFW